MPFADIPRVFLGLRWVFLCHVSRRRCIRRVSMRCCLLLFVLRAAVLTRGSSALLRSADLNDNPIVTEYLAQSALDTAFVSSSSNNNNAAQQSPSPSVELAEGSSVSLDVSAANGEGTGPLPLQRRVRSAQSLSSKPPLPAMSPIGTGPTTTGELGILLPGSTRGGAGASESSFVNRIRSRSGRQATSPSPPQRAGSASPSVSDTALATAAAAQPQLAQSQHAVATADLSARKASNASASSTPRPGSSSGRVAPEDPYVTIRQLVQTIDQLKVCLWMCVELVWAGADFCGAGWAVVVVVTVCCCCCCCCVVVETYSCLRSLLRHCVLPKPYHHTAKLRAFVHRKSVTTGRRARRARV